MSKIASYTCKVPTYGLLSAKIYRLARYSHMAADVEKWTSISKTVKLFISLFNKLPLNPYSSLAVEVELVELINESLFLLDYQMTSYQIYQSGEDLLMDGNFVAVRGAGIAWDITGLEDIDPSNKLLVYALCPMLLEGRLGHHLHDLLTNYFKQLGQEGAPVFNWIWWEDHQIIDQLNDLPSPLDGLSVLYKCITRKTGNPFIDYNSTYDDVYERGAWGWNKEDILELKDLYEEIQEDLSKLDLYYEWIEADEQRERIALQHLLALDKSVSPK